MAEATLPRQDFYVYVLFRHDTGEPFYVGKGKGKRHKSSLRDRHNPYKAGVIRKAVNDGREIPIVKVAASLNEDTAFAIEVALIAAIGRTPNGPLVNLTDGGDGTCGHAVPLGAREKLRIAAKAQMTDEAKEYLRRLGRAQFASLEARAALSAVCRKAQSRADRIAANKARGIKQAKAEGFRGLMSQISKAYNTTDAARRNNSEKLKAKWADPDYRRRVLDARRTAKLGR